MSLGTGKRSGHYNVFEMNSSLSQLQTPSQDHLESGNDDPMKKAKAKTARAHRISILLGATSLVVCITFLVTASVYYFQLRGESERETTHLKEEIKSLKRMSSNQLNSSAVQQIVTISVQGSKVISSLKSQIQKLRDSLNDSAVLNAAIQNLKQADSNYSRQFLHAMQIITQTDLKLSAGVNELKEAEENDEEKISSLKSQIEDLTGLRNDSKYLNAAVQNLKEVDSNYSRALLKESDEREQADDLQSQMMEAKFFTHEQKHLNESVKFNEAIQRLKEMGTNQSRSLWERITELRWKYLNFSDSMSGDIQEVKEEIEKYSSALEIEIQTRESEDTKNSQKFANEVEKLNQGDIKLMNYINALQLTDRNQTDALKAAEENYITQSEHQYSSLSDQIKDYRTADQAEFSKIATQLEELNQADLNQTVKLKTELDKEKIADSGRFDSLVSQLQQLKDASSNNSKALLEESVERRRMNSTLWKQIQDGINHLNASQSIFSRQLANLQIQLSETKAQIRTLLPIQSHVNKLTQTINLLAAGWKGNPSTILYQKFPEAVTFQTAVSKCQSAGGRLAAKVLRDSNMVKDLINAGYISSSARTWIGFDDINQEGTWRWSDGVETISATTRWYNGEPNNSGNEDCAEGRASSGIIRMNDLPCSLKYPYLCEISMI